ncbi:hypothetical protein J2810_004628 [Chryseobacterium rhizosphaerae]|uniref:hypothetical protein n=1 Tax=Chryseobacterium rhizosphaerae TaxID=395937 RepID=UPI002866423C|nr:hypothetical protein [Chryseobacterium rhizosphaerae]MDR6548538.1 hypothetical protein [Chryseobacterium rhizosphaerae]
MENNIEVITDNKIVYISVETLAQIMLSYGMSKQGFFRFCFSLLVGEVYKLDKTIFKIRSNVSHNETVISIIDENFINNYSET